MNTNIVYLLRAVLVMAIQVLLLRRMDSSWGAYIHFHFFLYPMLVFFAPINLNKALLMALAFVFGLGVDAFYDSPGLHASTMVLCVFIRSWVLKNIEPRGGYKTFLLRPTDMSWRWYFSYMTWLLIPCLLWYFLLEALGIPSFFPFILKVLLSYLASLLIIVVYILIFNPRV